MTKTLSEVLANTARSTIMQTKYFPVPTKCPFDGCRGRSIVTETRQRENWIYRLRRCHKDPSHRWSTEELTTKMWEKSKMRHTRVG